jgi:hypothetical protein
MKNCETQTEFEVFFVFDDLFLVDPLADISTVNSALMYSFGSAAGDTNASFSSCTNGRTGPINVNGFPFLGQQKSSIYVSEINYTIFRAECLRQLNACNKVVDCHFLTMSQWLETRCTISH